ncbi:PKD domain-containing protein [Thioflexithrix psekupsensis]|nr:PKD domain-containing protein [Thioflexithrix psekupsensis]
MSDKSVTCWGEYLKDNPLQGSFLKIAVSAYESGYGSGGVCGLKTDKSISCSGDGLENVPIPKGTFVDFSVSNGSVCAIRSQDNKIICWDNKGNLYSSVSDLGFVKLAKGSNPSRGCGILSINSNIACWGGIKVPTELNKEMYSQVFFSENNSLSTISGLSSKGRYISTLEDFHYLGDVLPNTFSQISTFSVGNYWDAVCGIRTDGALDGLVSCYEVAYGGGIEKPAYVVPIDGPSPANYKEISMSSTDSGCGIKVDNSIVCWGYNPYEYPKSLVINKSPTASFTADKTIGFAPLTIQFDASASQDADGSIKQYLWANDAGVEIDNTVKPSVTFTQAGSYTVTLTVEDDKEGKSTEVTQQIEVKKNSHPVAAFTMNGKGENDYQLSVSYDKNGIASMRLDASNSKDDNGIKAYSWKILNENTDEIITELSGIKPDEITFKTLIEDNYLVQLTVGDEQGLSDVLTKEVDFVNDDPVVKFTASPTSGSSPLTVQVDASESTDTQGIQQYTWQVWTNLYMYNRSDITTSFNIGNSAKESIRFDKPGSYYIKLIVSDKLGTSSEQNFDSISVQNSPPKAVIKATPTTGKVPLTVALDASDSTDVDGKIQNYEWYIVEEYYAIDNSVKPKSITFEKEGTYTLTLKVTDDFGFTSETTQKITVQAKESIPPVARISAETATQGNAPLNVTLSGSQSTDVDDGISKYEWSVSDGRKNQSGVVAYLTFDRVGSYIVTLKVTDNTGLSDSTSTTVTITDECVATYRPENQRNHLKIPCLVVSGFPLIGSGYEVGLQQRTLRESFWFDLDTGSDIIQKTVPESKCTAVYDPNSLNVHIPCIRYLDRVYDIYLTPSPSGIYGDAVFTFVLDLGRVKEVNMD